MSNPSVEVCTGVISVNGKTGKVVINNADLNAITNPSTKTNGLYLAYDSALGAWKAVNAPEGTHAVYDTINHVVKI